MVGTSNTSVANQVLQITSQPRRYSGRRKLVLRVRRVIRLLCPRYTGRHHNTRILNNNHLLR